jgi:methylenetetrahydrofolate dehydrogenase (NADP+)/methenyltetrahydrofolate cyclohydrolase
MNIDGRAIAAEIFHEVKGIIRARNYHPHMTVFTCEPNIETQQFLKIKKKKAQDVGVDVNVVELLNLVTTEDVIASIKGFIPHTDGIVVQLPFPKHIDIDAVIEAIPTTHDVDALRIDTDSVIPPVVGAIAEILSRAGIAIAQKNVVVVGNGRLVGRPAAVWCRARGGHVTVVTEADSSSLEKVTRLADILITGAGKHGLIIPEHVKEGVVILDAGTSEDAGEVKGDVDPQCALKAALFTPVPGGIGPITVAVLFKNLMTLATHAK